MKRVELDKDIKARTIEKAAEKFAEYLVKNGYAWAAEEMVESVENGYYYCCNATVANLVKFGRPVHPETNDWTYYWAIENIDGNEWYAWFIERAED
ncbi:MAG: hypothetical protein ACI4N6_04240 [Eubacteriales bacterium]